MQRAHLVGKIALCGVLLAACADSPSAPSGTFTVSGVVVDEVGAAQRDAQVLIVGHAPVYADAGGRFSVRGVRAPYDLAVGLLTERAALVYTKLTRADPTIVVPPSIAFPDPYFASYSGAVTGGAGPLQPANHKAAVLFESAAANAEGLVGGSYGFALVARWRGPTTSTGTLHALQWQYDPMSGLPVDYKAYGNAPGFTINSGESSTGASVAIAAPVTEGILSGSVTTPPGVEVVAKSLRIGFATSALFPSALRLLTDSGNATAFSYVTPALPGATFSMTVDLARGQASGRVVRTGFGANISGVVIAAPVLPALVSPAEGATDVGSATQFNWTRTSGAIYLLSITYTGTQRFIPYAPNFYVFTTDTTLTLPSLSPLGMTAYRGTDYVWDVRAWAPVGSVDGIAVPSWFTPRGDAISTVSERRSFTTSR